jgi:hypothetical protein
MIDNSYYSQDGHGPYELHDIGNLELEEGGTIRGCTLAYATFWHAQCRQRQRHPHSHLVLRHQQDHPRASWPVWVNSRDRVVTGHGQLHLCKLTSGDCINRSQSSHPVEVARISQ